MAVGGDRTDVDSMVKNLRYASTAAIHPEDVGGLLPIDEKLQAADRVQVADKQIKLLSDGDIDQILHSEDILSWSGPVLKRNLRRWERL